MKSAFLHYLKNVSVTWASFVITTVFTHGAQPPQVVASVGPDVVKSEEREYYTVTSGLTATNDLKNNIPDTARKITIINLEDWTDLTTYHKLWEDLAARPDLTHLTLNWNGKGITDNLLLVANHATTSNNIFRKRDGSIRLSKLKLKHFEIDLGNNDITDIRALTYQLWNLASRNTIQNITLKLRVTGNGISQGSIKDIVDTMTQVPNPSDNASLIAGKRFPNLQNLNIDITNNTIQFTTEQKQVLRQWYPDTKIIINGAELPTNITSIP